MVLNQVSNGLLFKDDFTDHNLLWSVNPDDENRYSFSKDGLTLIHGDDEITATISLPSEYNSYSILIEMNHEPTIDNDICGIRLFSLTGDRLNYESYYSDNDGSNFYKYIRINYDSKIYTFQASNDGLVWIEVGSADMSEFNELCRLCFFANDNGNEDGSCQLNIKNIYIYSNTIAIFKNAYVYNCDVYLTDKNNKLLNIPYKIANNDIIFDCSKILNDIECNLVVKDKSNNIMFAENNITLNSGDIYEYKNNIAVYINNELVNNLFEYDLGKLKANVNYIKMFVVNESESNTIYNKIISIDKTSPYSNGNERTYIALNDSDTSDFSKLRFEKECVIEKLSPKESIQFIIKISKENKNYIPYYDDKYRFNINII